jgi:hypothetical protein
VNLVVADTDDEAHRLTWHTRGVSEGFRAHRLRAELPTMAEAENYPRSIRTSHR